jgi:hypothetical protein
MKLKSEGAASFVFQFCFVTAAVLALLVTLRVLLGCAGPLDAAVRTVNASEIVLTESHGVLADRSEAAQVAAAKSRDTKAEKVTAVLAVQQQYPRLSN